MRKPRQDPAMMKYWYAALDGDGPARFRCPGGRNTAIYIRHRMYTARRAEEIITGPDYDWRLNTLKISIREEDSCWWVCVEDTAAGLIDLALDANGQPLPIPEAREPRSQTTPGAVSLQLAMERAREAQVQAQIGRAGLRPDLRQEPEPEPQQVRQPASPARPVTTRQPMTISTKKIAKEDVINTDTFRICLIQLLEHPRDRTIHACIRLAAQSVLQNNGIAAPIKVSDLPKDLQDAVAARLEKFPGSEGSENDGEE